MDEGIVMPIRVISQLWCALREHEYITKFKGNRMYLECMKCNHETPGIETVDRAEMQEIYESMVEVELQLSMGG